MDHPNIVPLVGYTTESKIFGVFGAFISPVRFLLILGQEIDIGWQWYPNGDAAMFLERHGNHLNMDERKKLVSATSLSGGDAHHFTVARRRERCLLPPHE